MGDQDIIKITIVDKRWWRCWCWCWRWWCWCWRWWCWMLKMMVLNADCISIGSVASWRKVVTGENAVTLKDFSKSFSSLKWAGWWRSCWCWSWWGNFNEIDGFDHWGQGLFWNSTVQGLEAKKLQKSWHLQKIKVEVCLESTHWHLSKTPEVKAKTPH